MYALHNDEVRTYFMLADEVRDPQRLASFAALLSPQETARMQRFVRAENRHEYLVAHALVRLALSRFAPVHSAAWVFTAQEHGRPVVATPAGTRLTFSLSHCQGLVACAIAVDRDVGVDVEAAGRATGNLSVADQFFSAAETAMLHACPQQQQEERFLQLWTHKEAYLKARGLGLALPLNGFSFVITEPDQTAVSFSPSVPDDPLHWQFARARPSANHVLAVAARVGQGGRIKISVEAFV